MCRLASCGSPTWPSQCACVRGVAAGSWELCCWRVLYAWAANSQVHFTPRRWVQLKADSSVGDTPAAGDSGSGAPALTSAWPHERMCHTLTPLADGRALLLGGRWRDGICDDAWWLAPVGGQRGWGGAVTHGAAVRPLRACGWCLCSACICHVDTPPPFPLSRRSLLACRSRPCCKQERALPRQMVHRRPQRPPPGACCLCRPS